MRAILQSDYGPRPEDVLRLGRLDAPVIEDDEVLVRVHAASVDRGTWHVMAGLPYPIRLAGFGFRRPKSSNPGRSFAGVVGSRVTEASEFRRYLRKSSGRPRRTSRSATTSSASAPDRLRSVRASQPPSSR